MFVHPFLKALRATTAALVAVALAACGGSDDGDSGSDGSADVRLVNATLTHANLSLLVGSSAKASNVALDTVSAYADVDAGSPTLQVNDSGTGTILTSLSPSLQDGDNYTLVAFESGGVVRATIVSENASQPSAGTAFLRIFDAAFDAGAVDVYVTDPAVDISTLSSPTFTFAASSAVQESSFLSFTPGTYRVRVTAAGNTTDLRLDIASITIASQEVATVVLTPTTGGTLVNGALIVQQGAYTASRNTNARVRLAAAVTPGATVSASVGATSIATGAVAPTVGAYVVVPAATTIDVSVNGTAIASPAATPAAGTDATLSVYGNAGAATATLIADDNRLPASASNLKMRLYNGLTGTPAPLTLTADFALVASNVQPGVASGYAVIPSSSSMRLDVTAGSTALPPQTNLNVPGNAVYTLFMLGSSGSPVFLLRRDR